VAELIIMVTVVVDMPDEVGAVGIAVNVLSEALKNILDVEEVEVREDEL
jgi:hypothetical protein